MFPLLAIIPLAALLSGFFIYRRTGRRDFLKFDAVQFIYAFILAPLLFVWSKSFLFYLLRQELNVHISTTELFFFDTVFSVVAMYVYSFVVIHSLTKSFELKRYVDPLYDIFSHSEALHLWISHTALYVGAMSLFTVISLVNVVIPTPSGASKLFFYFALLFGLICGMFCYAGIWLSNFTSKDIFMNIMKLVIAISFVLHCLAYFLADPHFNANYMVYWTIFMCYFAMSVCALIFERSERASGWFERFHHKAGWKKGNFMLSESEFKL